MADQEQESFRVGTTPSKLIEPVEQSASAPVQQADAVPEQVDLVGVVADEFGIARSVAHRDLMMGQVTVDGEPYHDFNDRPRTNSYLIPRHLAEGKTIEVRGGDTQRTYRFQIQ